MPTGFWDRKPKRTPGRLRRTLIGKPFPKDHPLAVQLRKRLRSRRICPKESWLTGGKKLFQSLYPQFDAGNWLNC